MGDKSAAKAVQVAIEVEISTTRCSACQIHSLTSLIIACKHTKAVVRGVSEVRGAIQHLISLLRDQPPFAPEIKDYIVRIESPKHSMQHT